MKNKCFVLLCYILPGVCAGQALKGVQFKSTDTALESAFRWAKDMALHYERDSNDPVGPWYESALPPRDAFCMRDVSHQSTGAEILGMGKENNNMFRLFAENISADKNWCSYWEINKSGKPAVDDYRSDKEFWYNLPANFDFLSACLNLYQWTGNKEYIAAPVFRNFFRHSIDDYIKQWTLQPDSLLTRPAHPNAPLPYNAADAFDRCRGLPSYSEGVQNIKMGVDLIAALYRGFLSYATVLKIAGDSSYKYYENTAEHYRQKIDEDWWNPNDSLYYTYYSDDNTFGRGEGETFLLWFDALKNKQRKKNTFEHLMSKEWNVENLSYLPLQMYRNGYWDEAYQYILTLCNPSTERRTYPEVSFGVIEGIVEGCMGVQPDASANTIGTIFRPNTQASEAMLEQLPVFGTTITVSHKDARHSYIINEGKKIFIWKAMFNGNYGKARVNAKKYTTAHELDVNGNQISFVSLNVRPGEKVNIAVYN